MSRNLAGSFCLLLVLALLFSFLPAAPTAGSGPQPPSSDALPAWLGTPPPPGADGARQRPPSGETRPRPAGVALTSEEAVYPPAPANMEGSSVTTADGYIPGSTVTMCFVAANGSPDEEWATHVGLEFPADWELVCVSQDVNDSRGNPVAFACSANANTVSYDDSDGGWGEIFDGATWGFCLDVTAPPSASGSQPVQWEISGDQWGDPPHTVSGTIQIEELPPGLYLLPDTLETSGCNGLPQVHNLRLLNHTGTTGTFDLAYVSAYSSLEGPTAVEVGHDLTVMFPITLTPELCLPNGLQITASVTASGNSYTDTTTITKTVRTGGYWQLETPHPYALFDWLVESAVDPNDGLEYLYVAGGNITTAFRYDPRTRSWTALAGTPDYLYDAGDGVAYNGHIYARTDGQANTTGRLFDYDIATDSWSSSPVPRTVTDRMWYEAVELNGWIYFIGGMRPSDWMVTGEVNRYNPVTRVWQTVASLNYPRALAMSWAYNGRIYVAGGNDGWNPLSSTEVYDPATNTWTEDPDLFAPLPVGWHGAADAIRNGDELWMMGGYNGSFTMESLYWTAADNTWHAGPPLARSASQAEADALLGDLYIVGGYNGAWLNFNQHLILCPECDQAGSLEGRVYDYDDVATPCRDATVHIEPGNLDVTVAPDGYYSVTLVPFDYQVTARAAGYPEPDGPYTVSIQDGIGTTRDFTLHRPDIDVAPSALRAQAVATSTVTTTLTISNVGDRPLDYEIREAPYRGAVRPTEAPVYRQMPAVIGVDPYLTRQFAAATADAQIGFFIAFKDTADLSPAYSMNWHDRGRFVVEALQQAAERAQRRVRAWLDARGIPYTSYWINNTIFVTADRATMNALAAFPEVSGFMGNHVYHVMPVSAARAEPLTPLGPAYPWNVTFPQADRVHNELGLRGEGIVVGGMDTGVEYTHPGLLPNYRGCLNPPDCTLFDHTYSWYNPGSDECGGGAPCDTDGHGTAITGIMAADDDPALPDGAWIGMAPNAQWIHCLGLPYGSGYDTELNACAQWFLAPGGDPDMRPAVVNHSWGSWSPNNCGGNWYAPALQAYRAADILPAFAAGNVGDWVSPPHCYASTSPANNTDELGTPLAFASGAHGSDGLIDYYSSGGPNACNPSRLFPDVASPGLGSCTTGLGGSYNCAFGGTSAASPHTAGCVALMRQANPDLTVAEVEQAIRDAADDVSDGCGTPGESDDWNNIYGEGRLNCYAAVESVYVGDVPWLAVAPVSATVSPLAQQTVVVSFTCDYTATVQAQPLRAVLRVRSNDPCQPVTDVPVQFFCSGENPTPLWEKDVSINGEAVQPVEGPHTVRPEDTVTVVDYVGAVFSTTITATLIEEWGDGLALLSYDTGGIGTVVADEHSLTWSLADVPSNAYYTIVKTFAVQYGAWVTDTLRERLTVVGAAQQPAEMEVAFAQHAPAVRLEKDGPATAPNHATIPLTLTLSSNGYFRLPAVLTDALPPGMAYAGGLTATYGQAWQEGNLVHWAGYTQTQDIAAIRVGVLSPDEDVQDLVDLIDSFAGIDAERITGSLGSMTLATLLPYDVIVTTNNYRWSDAGGNPNIGNVLASYVDTGGTLIIAAYAWDHLGWRLTGRLMSEGYTPYDTSFGDLGSTSLGDYDETHPVMEGVTSLAVSGNVAHQILPLEEGAVWIADWSDLTPCVYAQGNRVLGYNFLLDWTDVGWPWSGDVPQLLENSIRWLVANSAPPMPATVTIRFNARVSGHVGQTIRNRALVDWITDYAADIHDVTLTSGAAVYLPLVMRSSP